VDLGDKELAEVTIATQTGEMRMRARLVVAADGGSSHISRLACLAHKRQRVSTLLGFLVSNLHLPDPGYGHVFLGGTGPVLAYQIGGDTARIMFDLPEPGSAPAMLAACRANLAALPECVREEVRRAMETQRPLVSASYSVTARETTRGRLVLVGDAAGCCHPLTATGLTMCTRDAVLLRDALRDSRGDIPRGLVLYAKRRHGPQRTRLALAHALYEIFCGQTPEMRLVRDGMHEYWRHSGKGRSVSLALLSTSEGRLHVMLQELARVMAYGLGVRISAAWKQRKVSPVSQSRVLVGLSRVLLRHAGDVLRTS
jgi:2-polyprenyl-6-methoxyphenol hydroxylase-like FAD-dependent oxidoreductase